MGTITFDYRNPNGTLTDAPAVAVLQARLFQRETVGGAVRTIRKFSIKLVGGEAEAVLSDTGPNQCWVIIEPSTIAGASTFYKQVDGDAAFTALAEVDPDTFEPLDPFPPSAQEVLDEAATARDEAQGYATDALESADVASAFADDARDEALLAEGYAEDAAGSLASLNGQKGAVNGIGSLDGSGRQPESQVPARLSESSLNATIATHGLGQFEVQPMWLFGHSWQAAVGNASTGGRWWERVVKRLGMGTGTVKAISGRTIGDNTVLALSGTNAWVPRTKALVAAGCTINDLVRFSGSDAGRRAYIHAWRALLSVLTANGAVASNTASFVYTSEWVRSTVAGSASDTSGLVRNSTGGQQWHTETVGQYFEFTFTGTEVDVHLVAKIAGAGLVTFTEGGTARGALDLTATVAQEVPAIHRIRGLSSGTHTIRGTLTSGASLWVDSIRIPSTAPAPILVYGEPPLIWDNYGDDATLEALMTSFKGELATIVAEYPSAVYLDLNQAGWNPATMLTSDGIHPNDAGCAWIAGKAIEALMTVPYSSGLNVTGSSYPSAYVAPAGPSVPTDGFVGNTQVIAGPFSDDFNRTNSSSSLGQTSVGGYDYEILGTAVWGIQTNRAYCSSLTTTTSMAVIDTQESDGTYAVTIAALPSPANVLLPFRIVDINNYLALTRVSSGDTHYRLVKVVAGVVTLIGTVSTKLIEVNDVVTVELSGASIVAKVNGATIITASDSTFQTATKYGIYVGTSSQSALRYDDLSFTSAA